MPLKYLIDEILKEKNRSLSWLALEMGKTFDGLKRSLVRESIKYADLKRMAEILEISPRSFFPDVTETPQHVVAEEYVPYSNLRNELVSYQELVKMLKSQVQDKERIIELLTRSK